MVLTVGAIMAVRGEGRMRLGCPRPRRTEWVGLHNQAKGESGFCQKGLDPNFFKKMKSKLVCIPLDHLTLNSCFVKEILDFQNSVKSQIESKKFEYTEIQQKVHFHAYKFLGCYMGQEASYAWG